MRDKRDTIIKFVPMHSGGMAVNMVNKYWSEITKRIEPYIPGEQPRDKKYIKLNTNENPYPPSPRVLEAVRRYVDGDLRLYPDPDCNEFRETLAWYCNLKKEQIFVGNGSDELLAFSFMAFFNPGKPILFPDITYSFYPVYSNLFNIDYGLVPLDEEFMIPEEMFLKENGGIIFPNPNAPTGRYMPQSSIKKILEHNKDSVVIIDEAYVDFMEDSSLEMVDGHPNLLIIRTLSKSHSLAGLRVGYAIGHKDLIEGMNRIKNSINSYTLDRLALIGAAQAIRDVEYQKETRLKIIKTREWVSEELKKMGFNVTRSKANFIFISHPAFKAGMLFTKLKENGVLVRYFNKPRIDNYLRVSMGTDDEMDIFLNNMKQITGS